MMAGHCQCHWHGFRAWPKPTPTQLAELELLGEGEIEARRAYLAEHPELDWSISGQLPQIATMARSRRPLHHLRVGHLDGAFFWRSPTGRLDKK